MKDPNCEEASYFYFRTTENDKEPNNWRSNFGGSVWSRLPDGRWYYHTFAKEQPDLNWECKELRQKIYEMINWWLEKESPVFVSMQLPLSKRLKFCQSSYE